MTNYEFNLRHCMIIRDIVEDSLGYGVMVWVVIIAHLDQHKILQVFCNLCARIFRSQQ